MKISSPLYLRSVEVLYGRVGLVGQPQGQLVVPPLLLDLLPQLHVLVVELLLHLKIGWGLFFNSGHIAYLHFALQRAPG